MAQRGGGRAGARVPKFGEWGDQKEHDKEQNPVPYTMYFDNARKGKQSAAGGAIKIINPNDPEDNPEMFAPVTKPTPPRISSDHDYNKEPQHPAPVPLIKPTTTPYHHQGRPSPPPPRTVASNRRTSTGGGSGSEHSFDRSPLHPHYNNQAIRTTPGREHDNSSTSTPPRTRIRRPGTGSREDLSHHQAQGTVIPKFGDWNEQDPSSAEDLTQIFERSRNEKNYASTDRPHVVSPYNIRTSPRRPSAKINDHNQGKICGCFPW